MQAVVGKGGDGGRYVGRLMAVVYCAVVDSGGGGWRVRCVGKARGG